MDAQNIGWHAFTQIEMMTKTELGQSLQSLYHRKMATEFTLFCWNWR